MSWEVRTMRSGTSFFNAALFRKTFLRFWPIWALYTAGWTLVLPLRLWADAMRRSAWTAPELSEHLQNAVNGIPGLLEPGSPWPRARVLYAPWRYFPTCTPAAPPV